MTIYNNILLVDDDKDFLEVYSKILELNHYKVITASNGKEAIKIVNNRIISIMITDIIMPEMDGLELLRRVKSQNSMIQVIMLTAEGSVNGAVEAMHLGAFTYLEKPVNIEDLLLKIQRAKEVYDMQRENIRLKERLEEVRENSPLLGESSKIKEIRKKIDIVAFSDTNVLVTGESGTGKEIVANEIHNKSKRSENSFIKVNCAALAESVLESELFGHEKGAFTGAAESKKGRFEMADGGTIMLDEIGELPLGIQAKLLRVLQEKELERVGGNKTIKTDFRLVAVTNRNLAEEIKKGNFREDLYYRINVVPLSIPPLKERKEDIPLLCDFFLQKYCKEMRKKIDPLSKEIMEIFTRYDWPGNVRELKNLLERLVVLTQGNTIEIKNLPESMKEFSGSVSSDANSWKEAKEQFEEQFIKRALKRNHGNISNTASELGLARKSLYEKIKKYHMEI